MAEPGWYGDPQGGGGQRWWDGAQWTEHTSPPPAAAPQPPGAEPAVPGGYQTAAGTGPATSVGTTAPATGSGGGAGKVIALVVAAVVLLLVVVGGVVGWLFLGSSDDTATAGQISAGDSIDFVVDESGSFELDFDIPEGLVVIDVRGADGFDPVATLLDPETGEQIARNDDRSGDQLERYGGDRLDSLLELDLPAGSYLLEVTGFAQQGGPGEVIFPIVGD